MRKKQMAVYGSTVYIALEIGFVAHRRMAYSAALAKHEAEARETAQSFVPPGSTADVAVTDFVEFNVYVDLAEAVGRPVAAGIVRKILEHCAPYVASVRFVKDREVLLLVEKDALARLEDRSSMDIGRLEEMLVAPASPPRPRQ